MKALIHRYAPRALVNFAWNLASDLQELPVRLSDPRPRPWRTMYNVGGGDFYETGDRFFESFRDAVDLKTDDHVLDLGCGVGRLARPICAYLDDAGRYAGFDISQRALNYARKTVSGPCQIEFHHADLANAEYRRTGASAHSYRFPAEDASVDAALATSLFSHLKADAAEAYLAETGRVLKPGGRILLTAFIVEAEDLTSLESGQARLNLQAMGEGVYAADPRHPERAIGFDRSLFESWAKAAGLSIESRVPGDWRGPATQQDYQDRLVLRRIEG
ncbi:class I SAM-dependent methyltransferase [Maricaulaceae bacterium EIL42A08]|nr:class I SAM-dependent methyltransferase [Maricaulaceae bacterium EIL42A08]